MPGRPFEGIGGGPLGRTLAALYGAGQRWHGNRRAAHVEAVAAPVISVGNLVVGGAGKTPVTVAIARHLASRAPAIVSRGYGGTGKGPARVTDGSDPRVVGDEPIEMSLLAPDAAVWVARDRVLGARSAVDAGAGVVILDDGFGYRRLHRDVDLVLLDERGLGNRMLLPAGPLREPVAALGRASALLLRGSAEIPPEWRGPSFSFAVALGDFTDLDGKPSTAPAEAVAAAGIAWPQRFFDALDSAGIRLREAFPLADHTAWGQGDVQRIESRAGGLPIVITQKDAVKVRRRVTQGRWLVATARAELPGEFFAWLEERLGAKR